MIGSKKIGLRHFDLKGIQVRHMCMVVFVTYRLRTKSSHERTAATDPEVGEWWKRRHKPCAESEWAGRRRSTRHKYSHLPSDTAALPGGRADPGSDAQSHGWRRSTGVDGSND